MRLAGIREDDIIRANVRGDRFYALVLQGSHPGLIDNRPVLTIESLNGRPIPALHVTARQVVEHYARRASK